MNYTDLDPEHPPHRFPKVFRWMVWETLRGRRRRVPAGPPAPACDPDPALAGSRESPDRLSWIGHASFFCVVAGTTILIDPIFSRDAGWFYPRHAPPGLRLDQLPAIDLLLVSHSHYDHLDASSVKALPRDVAVVVPLGLGRWFCRRGFTNVRELGWWQAAELGKVRVTLVPARHWSRRTPWDTNRSLWGGFVIESRVAEGAGTAIYHAGDSGWFEGFRAIAERFPNLAAAMLPIGAYDPAWFMEPNHMNPEQAGRVFLELGARLLVPMHWGTFKLTDEPLTEPAERLLAWWRENNPGDGRELAILELGGTRLL